MSCSSSELVSKEPQDAQASNKHSRPAFIGEQRGGVTQVECSDSSLK